MTVGIEPRRHSLQRSRPLRDIAIALALKLGLLAALYLLFFSPTHRPPADARATAAALMAPARLEDPKWMPTR